MFKQEVCKIVSGGFHSLALTDDNKLFGFGKCSKGQLGFPYKRGMTKAQLVPKQINLPGHVEDIQCGSLFSMAMLRS